MPTMDGSIWDVPGRIIYRAGSTSPSNLTPRAIDKGKLSFRSTLSNPCLLPPNGRPVFGIGEEFLGINISNLPHSVSVDFDDEPPGHVTVRDATVEDLKKARVVKGRFPG